MSSNLFHEPDHLAGPRDVVSRELQRRTALVAVTVLSGLAIGLFGLMSTGAGAKGGAWLLLSTLVFAGLVLLYRKFEIGIVVFLGVCWMAIGTPTLAQGGGPSAQRLLVSQMGLLLLLGVWLTRLLLRQRIELYKTPLNAPIFLYLAICCWSTLNGMMFRDPRIDVAGVQQYAQVNILEVLIRFLALGGLLMIGNTLKGRELRWAALMIAFPGVVTFANLLPGIPTSLFLVFPQAIAMAMLSAFVLTGQGKLWMRVAAVPFIFSMLSFYAVMGAEWMSGWITALGALAVITFFAQQRLFWAGCAAGAVGVLLNWGYFYKEVYIDNFTTVSLDRFDMLRGSFLYAANFPLGIGLGNFRAYNRYYGRSDVWDTTTYSSAHGTYTQALSETGWLGLLTLLLLIAAATRMLYRYYQVLPKGWAKTYMLGALGSFLGIVVASFAGDYMFPAYHNGGMGSFGACVYVFLMIGVAIAIAREHGIAWNHTKEQAAEAATEQAAARAHSVAPIFNRPLA